MKRLALVFVVLLAALARAAQPNFLVIFIDDLGWGDLGCFGGTDAATPNIDRLAAEGLRFMQFYVNSPVCSPSRCALTTGQYPQRWRITSYLDHRDANARRGMVDWLDPAAPALPRALKSAGYATGHFGKWHLGGQRDVGDAPPISDYGFDESLTNFEGLGPRLLGLCDAHDGRPPRRHALGSDRLGRGPIIWVNRARLTTHYAEAALHFIERAAADRRPFYVNLWPDDVHGPWYPPRDRRGDGTKKALYRGVLEAMDEQLGFIFQRLRDDAALRTTTLVLFCSDNGPEAGAGSAGPLRGAKATLYEGGIRSPLIAWGPGLLAEHRAGGVNATSVFSAMDLPPTLLAIAGVAPPAGAVFDGENLADTLLGRADRSRRAPLFWRRPPDRRFIDGRTPPVLPDLAVREGPWKALCNYDGTGAELYNLADDPGETTNVAARESDTLRRLTAALLEWHRSMPPDAGATWRADPKPGP